MNYSYRDQWMMLKSIHLTEGDHKSMDCPFCHGRKKFSISKVDGKTLWNCYRASCNAKGVHAGSRSIDEAKAYLAHKKTKRKSRTTPIPSMTTDIKNYPAALNYVHRVNSFQAYDEQMIKIRYAPAEGRVLFYTADKKGAVGRSIKEKAVKWWTFGDTTKGIHVGNGSTAVLVEDAASACAVARIKDYTGVAILGTHLTIPILASLKMYKKSIIILDNDAKAKAMSLIRGLSMPSSMRITKYDLKYLNQEEIERLLNYGVC